MYELLRWNPAAGESLTVYMPAVKWREEEEEYAFSQSSMPTRWSKGTRSHITEERERRERRERRASMFMAEEGVRGEREREEKRWSLRRYERERERGRKRKRMRMREKKARKSENKKKKKDTFTGFTNISS
jgi:hypothetical protein